MVISIREAVVGIVGNLDCLTGFNPLANQAVNDAVALHDVTQALDTFFVVKVGPAGKHFDLLTGDDKLIAVANHQPFA